MSPCSTCTADRRHYRSVLRRPHHGNVRKVRRWLVLAASSARLHADRIADWAFPYKLCCVLRCSPDELRAIGGQTPSVWNLSGTFFECSTT